MTTNREYNRRYNEWVEKESLTVAEARAILDAVPESALAGMAKLNKSLPRTVAMRIFRACIKDKSEDAVLRSQIAKNIQREFGK
jgi:hypothetical protein